MLTGWELAVKARRTGQGRAAAPPAPWLVLSPQRWEAAATDRGHPGTYAVLRDGDGESSVSFGWPDGVRRRGSCGTCAAT